MKYELYRPNFLDIGTNIITVVKNEVTSYGADFSKHIVHRLIASKNSYPPEVIGKILVQK